MTNPTNDTTPRVLSLNDLADALVGVESSRMLLSTLEDLLTRAGAVPARLYLFDGDKRVFFPAAGFFCERAAADVALPSSALEFSRHRHPLRSRGDWVAMLEILAEGGYDEHLVNHLCAILAPTLVSIHHHEQVLEELRTSHEEVAQFVAAGELLRHLDIDVLLVKILETVMNAVRAEVGAVLTPLAVFDKQKEHKEQNEQMEPRVCLGLSQAHVQALRTIDGKPVWQHVLDEGQSLCLSAAEIAEQLDISALGAHLTGLLVLPLTTRGRSQGIVLLANPQVEFAETQRRMAETVCSLAAIALDNAMLVAATIDRERLQREMDLAHAVQTEMYPKGGLTQKELLIEGMSRPCDETGGDYFTYLGRNDQVLAMIGDVSGHGLGAALYTTMAHAVIQQQLRVGTAIEPAFRALNEALFHTQSGRFMTAALVEINASDGTFTYVSAGHNPLLWIHGGEVVWLHSCGMPLGIMPDEAYPPLARRLDAGDMLVLYTDGFTEAVNPAGEVFGENRLATATISGWKAGLGPAEMMQYLASEVDAWSMARPHGDDLTMIVIAAAATASIV